MQGKYDHASNKLNVQIDVSDTPKVIIDEDHLCFPSSSNCLAPNSIVTTKKIPSVGDINELSHPSVLSQIDMTKSQPTFELHYPNNENEDSF